MSPLTARRLQKTGARLLEPTGQYYDTFTGTFAGSVSVTLKYSDAGLTPSQERKLNILHYTGSQWLTSPSRWTPPTTSSPPR